MSSGLRSACARAELPDLVGERGHAEHVSVRGPQHGTTDRAAPAPTRTGRPRAAGRRLRVSSRRNHDRHDSQPGSEPRKRAGVTLGVARRGPHDERHRSDRAPSSNANRSRAIASLPVPGSPVTKSAGRRERRTALLGSAGGGRHQHDAISRYRQVGRSEGDRFTGRVVVAAPRIPSGLNVLDHPAVPVLRVARRERTDQTASFTTKPVWPPEPFDAASSVSSGRAPSFWLPRDAPRTATGASADRRALCMRPSDHVTIVVDDKRPPG